MHLLIGENIKRLRQAKNITQEKLAEHMNVSAPAISKWERGETLPDLTLIMPLASYFNVSSDELLGFDAKRAQEEVKQRLSKYTDLCTAFKTAESTQAIEALRQDFPNDFDVMMVYMMHFGGGRADENTAQLLEYAEEFISLCQRIQQECTVNHIRSFALYVLAKIYKARGEMEKAVACLNDFPDWFSTKGQFLEQLYEKYSDDFTRQVNQNLYELLDFAFNKAGKAIWYTHDTVEKRDAATKMLAAAIENYLAAAAYEKGWSFIAALYHEGGKVLCHEKHYEKAIEYYTQFLACKKRCDENFQATLAWVTTTPFLAPLRADAGFRQVLADYAK